MSVDALDLKSNAAMEYCRFGRRGESQQDDKKRKQRGRFRSHGVVSGSLSIGLEPYRTFYHCLEAIEEADDKGMRWQIGNGVPSSSKY